MKICRVAQLLIIWVSGFFKWVIKISVWKSLCWNDAKDYVRTKKNVGKNRVFMVVFLSVPYFLPLAL
jgi:hypothetical protein